MRKYFSEGFKVCNMMSMLRKHEGSSSHIDTLSFLLMYQWMSKKVYLTEVISQNIHINRIILKIRQKRNLTFSSL